MRSVPRLPAVMIMMSVRENTRRESPAATQDSAEGDTEMTRMETRA